MEQCIPQATLPEKRNLPWLNVELTKSMQARNLAYKRAKRSRNPNHWYAYRKKRNEVASQQTKTVVQKRTFLVISILLIQSPSGKLPKL